MKRKKIKLNAFEAANWSWRKMHEGRGARILYVQDACGDKVTIAAYNQKIEFLDRTPWRLRDLSRVGYFNDYYDCAFVVCTRCLTIVRWWSADQEERKCPLEGGWGHSTRFAFKCRDQAIRFAWLRAKKLTAPNTVRGDRLGFG